MADFKSATSRGTQALGSGYEPSHDRLILFSDLNSIVTGLASFSTASDVQTAVHMD